MPRMLLGVLPFLPLLVALIGMSAADAPVASKIHVYVNPRGATVILRIRLDRPGWTYMVEPPSWWPWRPASPLGMTPSLIASGGGGFCSPGQGGLAIRMGVVIGR
jgi:hypothetical protein